jgi:hypothetical protein
MGISTAKLCQAVPGIPYSLHVKFRSLFLSSGIKVSTVCGTFHDRNVLYSVVSARYLFSKL